MAALSNEAVAEVTNLWLLHLAGGLSKAEYDSARDVAITESEPQSPKPVVTRVETSTRLIELTEGGGACVARYDGPHSPVVRKGAARSQGQGLDLGHGVVLTDLEQEVLEATNWARQKPQEFADYVAADLQHFQGKLLMRPGHAAALRTDEGAAAWRETVAYLKKQRPVGALQPQAGITLAARDHCRDQGPSGQTGHDGTDGSTMSGRIERHGNWDVTCSENIFYGRGDGKEIVKQLIIDDGVPSRGHRTNMFKPDSKIIGIGCGPHKKYGEMCVQDFAGGYTTRIRSRSAPPRRESPETPDLPALAATHSPKSRTKPQAATRPAVGRLSGTTGGNRPGSGAAPRAGRSTSLPPIDAKRSWGEAAPADCCAHCKQPLTACRMELRRSDCPAAVTIHPECREAFMAATAPRCAHCKQPVTGAELHFSSGGPMVTLHPDCLAPYQASTAPKCKQCRKPITDCVVSISVGGGAPVQLHRGCAAAYKQTLGL